MRFAGALRRARRLLAEETGNGGSSNNGRPQVIPGGILDQLHQLMGSRVTVIATNELSKESVEKEGKVFDKVTWKTTVGCDEDGPAEAPYQVDTGKEDWVELTRSYNSPTFFLNKEPVRFEVQDKKLRVFTSRPEVEQAIRASLTVDGEK